MKQILKAAVFATLFSVWCFPMVSSAKALSSDPASSPAMLARTSRAATTSGTAATPSSSSEAANLATRQQQWRDLQDFRGGGVSIYIGSGVLFHRADHPSHSANLMMPRARAALWLALLLGVFASGCYAGESRVISPQRASALAADPAWTFAPNVPFVAQQSDSDCGPAALAMVLAHFGVPASLAEVVAADRPRDGGVRAGDLRDVARAKGLSAFPVAGTFADLIEQVGRGRPVLVGLAKPMTAGRALAHYEVVVAVDRHDPQPSRSTRREVSAKTAWRPSPASGRQPAGVTLIVFRPGPGDGRA